MKKMYYLMLTIFIMSVADVSSQVVIGNKETPHEGALLHLEGSGSNGLLFPKVLISDLSQWSLEGTPIEGMTVYNTAQGKEGVLIWKDGKWSLGVAGNNAGIPVAGISLSATPVDLPVVFLPGESITLQAEVAPLNASDKRLLWLSSNPSIAKVDAATGKIDILRSGGMITITVKALDGSNISAHFSFRVGAKVKAGQGVDDYLIFMSHNLGADETIDPLWPAKGLNGNYYQWGRVEAIATVDTPDGIISDFQNSPSQDIREPQLLNSNADPDLLQLINTAIRTDKDPCPQGWRLPTVIEWAGVAGNNTVTYMGNWVDGSNNYTSGVKIGTDLFLPAAGMRHCGDPYAPEIPRGTLTERNYYGNYWTSYEINPGWNAALLRFTQNSLPVITTYKSQGVSVRCVIQQQ